MNTKEKRAKTWMLIIETKSHRGLSCYRKVLFVTASDHHEAQAKARDWCSGEQITSISILPFDPNQMGNAMIDCTEKNPLPEHPNIDSRWISKYKSAETYFHKHKHVNLSAIELPSIRRYPIIKPFSFCKQPRDEQEGHSRNGPLLPARIWTCHIRTVEVPVVQFLYAASRGSFTPVCGTASLDAA